MKRKKNTAALIVSILLLLAYLGTLVAGGVRIAPKITGGGGVIDLSKWSQEEPELTPEAFQPENEPEELTPTPAPTLEAEPVQAWVEVVVLERDNDHSGKYRHAEVSGYDAGGKIVWMYVSDGVPYKYGATEPIIELRNEEDSAYLLGVGGKTIALDRQTGEELWINHDDAGINPLHFTDAQGYLYMSAYEDCDLCILDAQGRTVAYAPQLAEGFAHPIALETIAADTVRLTYEVHPEQAGPVVEYNFVTGEIRLDEVQVPHDDAWMAAYAEKIAQYGGNAEGALLFVDGDDIPELFIGSGERDSVMELYTFDVNSETLRSMQIRYQSFCYRVGQGRFLNANYEETFMEEQLFALEDGVFREIGVAGQEWEEDEIGEFAWDGKSVSPEVFHERYEAEFGHGQTDYPLLQDAQTLNMLLAEWNDPTHPTGSKGWKTLMLRSLLNNERAEATLVDLNGDGIPEMYIQEEQYQSARLVVYDERTMQPTEVYMSWQSVLARPETGIMMAVEEYEENNISTTIYRVTDTHAQILLQAGMYRSGRDSYYWVEDREVKAAEYETVMESAFPNRDSALDLGAQCRSIEEMIAEMLGE